MNNTEFVEDGKIFYLTDDICPDCGEYVADSWKFCPYCSYDLTLCSEKK